MIGGTKHFGGILSMADSIGNGHLAHEMPFVLPLLGIRNGNFEMEPQMRAGQKWSLAESH